MIAIVIIVTSSLPYNKSTISFVGWPILIAMFLCLAKLEAKARYVLSLVLIYGPQDYLYQKVFYIHL